MRSLFLSLCLVFVAVSASGRAVFLAPSDGVLKVEDLVFRLQHWGADWSQGSVQSAATVTFPGEAAVAEGSRKIRRGEFRAANGTFTFVESIDLGTPERADFSLELTSPEAIPTQLLVLSTSLPLDAKVVINGRPVGFGADFDPARWKAWGGKAKDGVTTVEISLRTGRLTLSGDFSAELQDNRRYKQDNWGLRLGFRSPPGTATRFVLSGTMRFEPYRSTPLDLSAAANMGFHDEVAEDRRGGWTDEGPENDLRALPAGERDFSGLTFRIPDDAATSDRSCVALRGEKRPWLPESATVETGNVRAGYLYVLSALGWEDRKKPEVGEIIARYADGTEQRFPVSGGRDTANFWNPRRLVNAYPVWTGRNERAPIGLYAAKFQLSGKLLSALVFRSSGNAVWLIAAASVSDDDISPVEAGPVVMEADASWVPIRHEKPVRPGSILDCSDLLDAPAGKYGFLTASGGRFFFSGRPEKNVRFWGVNLTDGLNFPTEEEIPLLVEELAATGYNLVRFHHFDQELVRRENGASTALDPARIDRMDALAAACKKRGIYLTLDLFTKRMLEKGEIPEFPDRAVSAADFKALAFINENAMKNLETFSSNLLNHVNPYTGLAWKDDPALISISLINENTLSRVSARSEFLRGLYAEAFEAYKREKHLTVTEAGRPAAYQAFIHETYNRGFARLRNFLLSLGVRVPLTDQNYTGDIPSTALRRQYGYVDMHAYWGHPNFIGSNWRLPAAVDAGSAIEAYGGAVSHIFGTRIFGLPFAITEWDHVNPNPFSVEGAFLFGAYSALQEYGMLCRFNYSWTPAKLHETESHLGFFDIANDPLRLLSERAGVFFFLRGDVSPSQAALPFCLPPGYPDAADHPRYFPQAVSRVGLIGKTGTVFSPGDAPEGTRALLAAAPIQSRLPVVSADSADAALRELAEKKLITPNEYDHAEGRFTSSTGELTLNHRARTFRAVTPHSEGFVAPAGTALAGKFAEIRNRNSFSAVLVASRDDRPLAESERILILHLTELKNTGMRFSAPDRAVLEKYGTPPLLMLRGGTDITLRTTRPGLRLYACGFDGARKFELTPERLPGGTIRFSADNVTPQGTVAVYELTKE